MTPQENRVLPAGLIIFGVALLTRMIYVRDLVGFPLADAPVMDALYHHEWAKRLAAGDWWGKEVFFRAPVYPYFLGLVYKLFGEHLWLPRCIQLVIGSCSCVLIFLIGRDLFDRRIGIISGIVAAFYGPFIYFEGELLVEVLMIVMLLLGLWFLIRGRPLAGGLLLGVAAITRPNILIFILFVPVFMLLQSKDWKPLSWKTIGKLALPWVGAGLVILPVTFRNWVVGRDLVLIASQGGVNFYIGNNPESNGITAVVPGTRPTWWGGYSDTIRIAEEAEGRELKPSEVSQYWFRRAFAYIRNNPGHWLGLMARKTYIFWQGFEPPNNEDLYVFSHFSPLQRLLIWKSRIFFFPFGLLAPLALCGMVIALRDWRRHVLALGFIFLYAASVIAFFVCARFRIPVVTVIIPYAVFFVAWMCRSIPERRPAVWPLAALCTGLLFLANADFLRLGRIDHGDTEFTLGNYYSDKKLYRRALDYYHEALVKNPRRADVHNNIGNMYLNEGRLNEALKAYQRALDLDPNHATSYDNLGSVLFSAGHFDQALEYLLIAQRLDPRDPSRKSVILTVCDEIRKRADKQWELSPERTESRPVLAVPYYRLGFAYYQIHEPTLAMASYQKASDICPTYADAYNDRANVLSQLGRTHEAKPLYLKALEVNPDYAPACQNLIRIYEAQGDLQRADEYRARWQALRELRNSGSK